MEEPKLFISDVRPGLQYWTVKITITEEMPELVGYQRGTKYKRYMFTDDKGTTIPVVVYGADVRLFVNTLRLHGVYEISNAQVRVPSGTQNMHGYPLHWILQRDAIIRPLPTEEPNLSYFLNGLISLNKLGEALVAKPEGTVDIMAILIKATPPRHVTIGQRESIVQNFTILDIERFPVMLSLWDQQVEKLGNKLTEAAASYSVIVAKRLKVKNHRGPAVSANNATSFTIDPPLEEVVSLKSWFDSIREMELPGLLDDYSTARAKDQVDRGLVIKYSISQIQANDMCGDFWTRAFLQLAQGEQRLFYVGCTNCYTKVSGRVGSRYQCLVCKKHVLASMRPRVSMDVYDHSGVITVGAIESVAEEILQCGATQLAEMLNQGVEPDLEHIRARFADKMYLILIRRSNSRRSDGQRRLLLAAFFNDTLPPEPKSPDLLPESPSAEVDPLTPTHTAPTPSSEETPSYISPLSPFKRPLDDVTIQSGNPAKRALFQDPEVADSTTGAMALAEKSEQLITTPP